MNDANKNENTSNQKKEGLLGYLRTLTWPIIVLLLIFYFASPLNNILGAVPEILKKSESIEILNVKIKLDKKIAKQATPEIKKALAALSEDDIETMLQVGKSGPETWTTFSEPDTTQPGVIMYNDWARLGLVTVMSKQELKDLRESKEDAIPPIGFRYTKLFQKTRNFLTSLLTTTLFQTDEKDDAKKEDAKKE